MKTLRLLVWGSGAVLALTVAAGSAQAWGNWSIGVGIGGPGYYRPYYGGYYYGGYYRPYPAVIVAPPPVVVGPAPYVVQPAPVVVQQQPAYAPPPPPAAAPLASQPGAAPAPQRLQSYRQPEPISTPPPLTPVAAGNPNRPQEISRCLGSLADANEGVRLDAVTQLGHLKAYQAIDPLAATLAGDRSSAVREAAARALGLMRNPKALPALQRAVQVDADHDVRRTAQFSIEIIQSR